MSASNATVPNPAVDRCGACNNYVPLSPDALRGRCYLVPPLVDVARPLVDPLVDWCGSGFTPCFVASPPKKHDD